VVGAVVAGAAPLAEELAAAFVRAYAA